MSYADYLAHFNPNHDPRNGQFASNPVGAGARIGGKVGKAAGIVTSAAGGAVAFPTLGALSTELVNAGIMTAAAANTTVFGTAFLTGVLMTAGTALVGTGIGAAAGLTVAGVKATVNAIKRARENKHTESGN